MSIFIFLALMCLLVMLCVIYIDLEKLSDNILDLQKDLQKEVKKKGKK